MFGRVRGHGDVGEKRNLPSFVCKRIGRMDTSTGTFGLLAIAPALLKRKPCTIAAVSSPRAAGASEVSRSSCMKFLGVSGVFDFAGLRGLSGD